MMRTDSPRRWLLVSSALLALTTARCECGDEPLNPQGSDAGVSFDASITTAYADPDERQLVMVLGDSMATDLGVPYAASFGALLMENDDEAHPELDGLDLATLRPGSDRYNLAVEGARADDVVQTQLVNLPDDATLVIVAMGLNDYLDAAGDDLSAGGEAAARFSARLQEVMSALRDVSRFQALPHVYVLNIYDATDEAGDTQDTIGVVWPDALAVLQAFNDAIAAAAVGVNTHLIDVRTPFLGHGVHFDDPANAHFDSVDATGWYQADYVHPARRGHHEIRRLLLDAILGS